jgi:hypothetical protein
MGVSRMIENKLTTGMNIQEDVLRLRVENEQLQLEKMKCCGNCKHYSRTYGLCQYSLGDEDYDCGDRKWEMEE